MLRTLTVRIAAAWAAIAVVAIGGFAVANGANGGEKSQRDLGPVRGALAKYHDPADAEDAGWGLIPGLDFCFESAAGGMGIHYIDGERLDTLLDPLRPEALVYHHLPNGKLHLGAVEYIVPAALWDAEAHGHDPMVLGQHLHLNTDLGVYVLHAWLFTENPDGIYEDWNPRVSCPS